MTLDLQKIRTVLTMAPLCQGTLIYVDENEKAFYCAQGALLRAAGLSQERVMALQLRLGSAIPATEELPGESDQEYAFRHRQQAEVWRLDRVEANDEIQRTLKEEYGLPVEISELIPGWNDNDYISDEDRAEHVCSHISDNAQWYECLTTGGTGTTLSHDNNDQAPRQEAGETSDVGRALAHTTEAAYDTAGSGDCDSRRSPDSGTLGEGPNGAGLLRDAVRGDLALATVGQASG